MLYLPACLGALARLAAKENPRYAVDSLRVFEFAEGRFRVEATDGRRLGIVRGYTEERDYPALTDADDDATELLIPAAEWSKAFKSLASRSLRREPLPVGLAMGSRQFTFATLGQSLTGTPGEGRFPAVDEALPKRGAMFSVRVDAHMLADLLTVAATFSPDDSASVDLHFFTKNKPLGLTTGNGNLHFDGLIMPLS